MISTVNDDDTAYGLIIAASRGHTEICRLILEKRPNAAHYVDAQHWNAFRSAACNNNVEIIDLLTKYG
ncbi:unnamed protein product [Dracunculus medinensis]|uniref:ANK_REP_REGION domain-containing protein n=1 Tax=Dracunculus medinensis TaxID=318479 RepID=A0A0N4UA52_DRAME|nr:unnamed protein product [Dracunculus medinensis]